MADAVKKSGKKPADRKPAAKPKPNADKLVAEWVDKAPEFRGLRRPSARAKALVLVEQMQSKGLLDEDGEVKAEESEQVQAFAEFVADIDTLLGELGGDPYIDFIESVPMEDMLQFLVLIEIFSSRVIPVLGKG